LHPRCDEIENGAGTFGPSAVLLESKLS